MITSTTVREIYDGNNSTVTPYVIPFKFLEDGDIIVIVTDSAGDQTTLTLTSDYVVTGAGDDEGGSLVTTAAIPVDSTVTVVRRTPVTQTTQYVEADEFPAASHELAFDKVTMQNQEQDDVALHSFRLSARYDDIDPLTPVNDALLGLDPAGVPIFKTASEVLTWLQLVQTLGNFPTKTFANAAERGVAVPDFIGQLGTQRDTQVIYMGTALSAGSWSAILPTLADGSVTTAKLADGTLSADAAGRLKMAAAYLMGSHLNADILTSQTLDTLLDDSDILLGYNGTALRAYAGNVIVPPGTIIQTKYAEHSTYAALGTAIPADDTIPQITEGTQFISLSITPRFANSDILLTFTSGIMVPAVASGVVVCAIFRNPVTNAIAANEFTQGMVVARDISHMSIVCRDQPATTSATTYSVRVGGTGGGVFLNGLTTRLLGGASKSTLLIQEIKV